MKATLHTSVLRPQREAGKETAGGHEVGRWVGEWGGGVVEWRSAQPMVVRGRVAGAEAPRRISQ